MNKDISFTIACCDHDVHYAKAAVASIRRIYPNHTIFLICDENVRNRDKKQFGKVSGVEVLEVQELTKSTKLYFRGLLTKLYLFFAEPIQKTVFVDADSVLTGPVLELLQPTDTFVPFVGSWKDLKNKEQRAKFSKWAVDMDRISELDDQFPQERAFFCMTSHFYTDTRKFPIEYMWELLGHLNFRREEKTYFREDQGFITYALNKIWNGSEAFDNSKWVVPATPESESVFVAESESSTPFPIGSYFIHYIGGYRKFRLNRHHFHECLCSNYEYFYQLSGGASMWFDEMIRCSKLLDKVLPW